MSQTRMTDAGDEGRRIPWPIGVTPMASLGRDLGRGRDVKGASAGGCWKGAGSTFVEE